MGGLCKSQTMDITEIILTPAWTPINTFRHVELSAEKEKPLVLLDIDDTVITWKRQYSKFVKDSMIEVDTNTMYNYFIMMNDAEATDLDGFNDLVKRVKAKGGEVRFLTSRKPEYRSLTLQRLKAAGIDHPDNYSIYFVGSQMHKGTYIVKNLNFTQYGEVVFVDDLDVQLSSVKCMCPEVRLYQFKV
jgi:predicted secreted acid phosphatase